MLFRVGIALIVLSIAPWLWLCAALFFGVSLTAGVGLSAAAAVAAEVMFWSGLAVCGKDTLKAVKCSGMRRAPRELVRLFFHGRPDS
ncbi:transporter suffix domain-containing protein [Mycobacteroides abscessus]|uniref:transporter suffix domain-containing protein n=1 Tax=Mycobacteroides abscessus TaxID=36809 RepID=UPI0009274C90|nr:transporter suffix domain-containing protein [Mycobacteroides abscessus]UEA48427.1 transporter suffix domain-containing protein [Mycobacteroides abscessus subsp. abscessus]UEA51592.1 transporter suffix domain-containing protein [Mycobacteroides abscessus]SIH92567.1 Uncharacterised protein [Mycobacteroides abscessus subsp. bolletii]SLE08927.1 Uncharacterised protein [Mycobacteroides abscessus subsp. bolletii]SLE93322.1 Uncharacterised protein [Mycobacteroides abscessus subsp. bolletii]